MTKRTIKYDRRNFRKHSAENKAMIRKSLEELGAGRSVVVDAENELIAGNGVYEQAEREKAVAWKLSERELEIQKRLK